MSTVAERHGGADSELPEADGPGLDSGAVVDQHRSPARGELRADFGAHLETHYARLVAQLYAITLHPGHAHDAVQDAYSRAWRRWSDLDPDEALGWIRRVAISTSTRGWRTGLTRLGLRGRSLPGDDEVEPETAALLRTLDRLGAPVRRAIVLRHMVGLPIPEIAELERVAAQVIRGRLAAGRAAVIKGMAGRVAEGLAAVDGDDSADGWLPRGRHAGRRARGERA